MKTSLASSLVSLSLMALVWPVSAAPPPAAPGRATLGDALRASPLVMEADVVDLVSWSGTMGRGGAEAIWSSVVMAPRQVVRDLEGQASGEEVALTVLGGTVDERTMHVSHLPRFAVGDRVIVLADPGRPASPTFHGTAGVLRVVDGRVYTWGGDPVVGMTPERLVLGRSAAAVPTVVAPQPVGSSRGRVVQPPSAPALTVSQVLDALTAIAQEVTR